MTHIVIKTHTTRAGVTYNILNSYNSSTAPTYYIWRRDRAEAGSVFLTSTKSVSDLVQLWALLTAE
jgi:hypothetical protein